MELFREVGPPQVVFARCPPEGIGRVDGSPMQRAPNTVATVGIFGSRIAPPFGNVNLPTGRPRPVSTVSIRPLRLWHHPDCGPKPIAHRWLCHHFHSTIGDTLSAPGVQPGAAHGIDDGPRSDVAANRAIVFVFAQCSAGPCRCQIEHIVVVDVINCDVG